jgi:hypothetical protein
MEYHMEPIAPFGPLILKAEMPDDVTESINQIADRLIEHNEDFGPRDWLRNLAGNIRAAIGVTDLMQNEPGVVRFLTTTARQFGSRCHNLRPGQFIRATDDGANLTIAMTHAWINEMVAGDYSPLHFHAACDVSCVGFLRVPPNLAEELASEKGSLNGCLHFIDGRTSPGSSNMYWVQPSIGHFYLFPSWLLHCVYPFRSVGVRRSFSANLCINPEPG